MAFRAICLHVRNCLVCSAPTGTLLRPQRASHSLSTPPHAEFCWFTPPPPPIRPFLRRLPPIPPFLRRPPPPPPRRFHPFYAAPGRFHLLYADWDSAATPTSRPHTSYAAPRRILLFYADSRQILLFYADSRRILPSSLPMSTGALLRPQPWTTREKQLDPTLQKKSGLEDYLRRVRVAFISVESTCFVRQNAPNFVKIFVFVPNFPNFRSIFDSRSCEKNEAETSRAGKIYRHKFLGWEACVDAYERLGAGRPVSTRMRGWEAYVDEYERLGGLCRRV